MLERLTKLLQCRGYITGLVIGEADWLPSIEAYATKQGVYKSRRNSDIGNAACPDGNIDLSQASRTVSPEPQIFEHHPYGG